MMNEIAPTGFLAGAFSIKASIRIGHAPVGPVGKPLPPKIARLLGGAFPTKPKGSRGRSGTNP
ncbi:MAG: hypothetical protein HSCHL_2218 [Hydrogenibacillus schlegelii]|uniref:Uncharacterized protein n=1 Tax=Hydrogenibacillus schlegelii TaxID=1484 RepID=A0A2T5GEK6_HYDSH|nr:MAG: hypothetical protein HSCHL_2218 [Hydrogenibacillus schlegelii]